MSKRWAISLLLLAATFVSTTFVGAIMSSATFDPARLHDWSAGLAFSVPLLAILVTHELAHYVAGRIHGVDVSPPYFIPLPIGLLGTMGAVIQIKGRIRDRNALLDIGASGPLAGFAVALPVLLYGIATSPVQPAVTENVLMEGRSLLYVGLLYALKGPIPSTHDIFLTPTAFAGWAGLLLTMVNLVPSGQLDGGHIAYALLGKRQDGLSERIRKGLPLIAVIVGLVYAGLALREGRPRDAALGELLAGFHWLVWAVVLFVGTRLGGKEHPPTETGTLSPARRAVGIFTMLLFLALFTPSWMREL